MAKKKILSEAQVRRFMGLAGLKPLTEMDAGHRDADEHEKDYAEYLKQQLGKNENLNEDELEDAERAEKFVADDVEDAEDDLEGAEEAAEEVSIDQELIDDALGAIAKLEELVSALGGEEAAAEDNVVGDLGAVGVEDELADDDEVDAVEDEEDALLEGVQLQLSQKEIVNEVAKRVAKRIVSAKKAQQRMNEALGRRTPPKRRRKK
jgi:hypothetical protein